MKLSWSRCQNKRYDLFSVTKAQAFDKINNTTGFNFQACLIGKFLPQRPVDVDLDNLFKLQVTSISSIHQVTNDLLG